MRGLCDSVLSVRLAEPAGGQAEAPLELNEIVVRHAASKALCAIAQVSGGGL